MTAWRVAPAAGGWWRVVAPGQLDRYCATREYAAWLAAFLNSQR